jgi:hypothetical protein
MSRVDEPAVLSREDAENYTSVVTDRIANKTLESGVHISAIRQIFSNNPDATGDFPYLGAMIIVDSPTIIRRGSGAEPSYRYWIIVDVEWNESMFSSVGEAYQALRKLIPTLDGKLMFRYMSFYPEKKDGKFYLHDVSRMYITNYGTVIGKLVPSC